MFIWKGDNNLCIASIILSGLSSMYGAILCIPGLCSVLHYIRVDYPDGEAQWNLIAMDFIENASVERVDDINGTCINGEISCSNHHFAPPPPPNTPSGNSESECFNFNDVERDFEFERSLTNELDEGAD